VLLTILDKPFLSSEFPDRSIDMTSLASRATRITTLQSYIDIGSEEFLENRIHHLRLLDGFRQRLETVQRGGPEASLSRHRGRGKLTARERINTLVDPESPFRELSPLAAWSMYDNEAPPRPE